MLFFSSSRPTSHTRHGWIPSSVLHSVGCRYRPTGEGGVKGTRAKRGVFVYAVRVSFYVIMVASRYCLVCGFSFSLFFFFSPFHPVPTHKVSIIMPFYAILDSFAFCCCYCTLFWHRNSPMCIIRFFFCRAQIPVHRNNQNFMLLWSNVMGDVKMFSMRTLSKVNLDAGR